MRAPSKSVDRNQSSDPPYKGRIEESDDRSPDLLKLACFEARNARSCNAG